MKDSDILLAPSVTAEGGDQEGIPVVLMEALAQGLPVISTYHSGIPELVQDGVSGYLVHERDVNVLSERLEHLIKNQELWAKMGRAGRNYIENYYNIDKLNEQLVEIFQKLLNRKEST
jgi:colanic acid/amylovoran biosynthesis glycosyltransferase